MYWLVRHTLIFILGSEDSLFGVVPQTTVHVTGHGGWTGAGAERDEGTAEELSPDDSGHQDTHLTAQ